MTSMFVQALDARVRIDAPDPIGALFSDLFGDLTVDDDGRATDLRIVWRSEGENSWHVALGEGGHMGPTAAADGLAESIIEVNSVAAASVAGDSAVLHAGAFEVDGRAVAVTGMSGAGKSTLVAAAVLRGHGFLADEVCSIQPSTYDVRPYYRPIGLRTHGAAAIGVPIPEHPLDPFTVVYPWQVSPHGRLAGPVPLRLVALANRRPGPVEIVTIRPAEALVRLTELTLGTDGVERAMFLRLEQLVRAIEVVTISYDDSFAAVDALAERVCA